MDTTKTATIKKKTEMVGEGCALQGLGLLCPFIGSLMGLPGIAAGVAMFIALFIIGSARSQKLLCSNCGTTLANKHVRECPSCHSLFQ